MFLSAINALTLSPALCAILLKPHHGPRRGIIGWVMRSIDYIRDAYGSAVARLVRISIIGLVFVAASMIGIVGLSKITPTGFLPEDDQGAFFVVTQLPGGASSPAPPPWFKSPKRSSQKNIRSRTPPRSSASTSSTTIPSRTRRSLSNVKPFEERTGKTEGANGIIERLNRSSARYKAAAASPSLPRQSSV